MAWVKKGLVFDPATHAPWINSHAQVPTAFEMDDRIRIYFAGRNDLGKSFMTYVDLNKAEPTKILYVHDQPIIPLGKLGTFDDEGMMPSDLVKHQGRLYFYYSGWNQRAAPGLYHNTTGVVFSEDGGATFKRDFEGPILDRTPAEPYMAVTPVILLEEGLWQMWYVAGTSWQLIDGKCEPVYVIKYAHSTDGISWVRPPEVCIKPNHELEAYSRPSVVKDGDVYKMWYSYRDSNDFRGGRGSYRLGYSESANGRDWVRKDDSLVLNGATGSWENEMQCYPYVADVAGKRYMFYNGNGFGRSGFGIAEWVA